MLDLIKKVWKDPVWSKVISAGILALFVWLGYQFDFIRNDKTIFFEFFQQEVKIQVWIVFLILIINIVLLFLSVRYILTLYKVDEDDLFHSYCYDKILGLTWRWDYSTIDQIINLHSFCPNCDFQLIKKMDKGFLYYSDHCSGCGFELTSDIVNSRRFEENVILKIQQKIRNSEWKTVVNGYKNGIEKNKVRKQW